MQNKNLLAGVFSATTIALCVLSGPSPGQDPDLKQLTVEIKSRDVATRRTAIEALGRRGEEAGVDLLIGALQDPDQEVRSLAAITLGQMGFEKAAPALAKMLRSNQPRDRR